MLPWVDSLVIRIPNPPEPVVIDPKLRFLDEPDDFEGADSMNQTGVHSLYTCKLTFHVKIVDDDNPTHPCIGVIY
jgi:hypothetical protein